MSDVEVDPVEVRRSAAQIEVVAQEASSSRAAVADSVSTQESAWKESGKPGFAKFVDILEEQADRLRTDLTDLGDKLRAAADAYEQQDEEAGGALDTTVR